ncbi:MAG: hypothetical protein ABSA81_04720 [Candidatus Bathyarchaeia archaeon]
MNEVIAMQVPRSTTTQRMVSPDYGPQMHYPNHREYARAVGEKGQKHWERYAAAQGISTVQTHSTHLILTHYYASIENRNATSSSNDMCHMRNYRRSRMTWPR